MLLEVFYLLHLLLFTVALLHGSRSRTSSSSRSRCCAVACLPIGRRARLGTRLCAPPPRLHLSLGHRLSPLPAPAAVHDVQRKPRPPPVWPTQPLLVRLQPRRAPFLPRGSSVPAPSARHGPWLIRWLRPMSKRDTNYRLPISSCPLPVSPGLCPYSRTSRLAHLED